MPLLTVVLILALVGVGLYLLNNFVTMDAKIKTIINVFVVVVVIIWLCNLLGIFGALGTVRTPRIN